MSFLRRICTLVGLLSCAGFFISARASLALDPPSTRVGAESPVSVVDATHLREPEFLEKPWLVQAGDDPAWARTDFDDSHWLRFNPSTSIVAVYGKMRPKVIWYRLHLKVDPAQRGLALNETSLARAFEVYVNGESLFASGCVAPLVPYTLSQRRLVAIPDRMVTAGSLVIALRVAISASEWSDTQHPGYFATNLTIGQYDTMYRENWLDVIGQNAVNWLQHLFLIAVGLVALVLFIDQRSQRQYLWIAAVGALALIQLPIRVIPVFHDIRAYWQVIGELPRLISPFIWTSLYFSFVHQRIGWRWRAFLLVAGVCDFLSAIQSYFFPVPLMIQLFGNLPFVILLAVIIPFMLAVHWWRGNREAGILLIPAVLLSLTIYAQFIFYTMFQFPVCRETALKGIKVLQQHHLGPFTIPLNDVSDMLSAIALAIIMVLRSLIMSRRQALLEAELAAARQVQQVLVPEETCGFPAFAIESVYEPAQQVGGDFFQVLKTDGGGALVVVGDVAGKGLPAAMLVSTIVGLIRGIVQYTCDPTELLGRLNDQLVGRSGGGFCTALVAQISADGSVTVANAGHLPPYLDGKEVTLPGALPLGLVPGLQYEATQFYLPAGRRLALYSDGVVEATNAAGELFGFDRGREISGQPASAIVRAAKQFGQQDDITVVTIARTEPLQQPALAQSHEPAFSPALAND